MSDSLDDSKRLEGQLCHNLSLEVSSNEIKNSNHDNTHNNIAFHGIEHHLLTGLFKLIFNGADFLFMRLVLSLNNMSIFEFF